MIIEQKEENKYIHGNGIESEKWKNINIVILCQTRYATLSSQAIGCMLTFWNMPRTVDKARGNRERRTKPTP